jgi:dTMP kinase
VLISFEGLSGAGKTTQSALLRERLAGEGATVAFLPDILTLPSDELGERLFNLFVSSGDPFMRHNDVITETYLAAAMRANIVAACIEPALETHDVVIEDRGVQTMYSYSLASVLRYHAMSTDAVMSWLKALGGLAGREADIAVWLRVPVGEAVSRAEQREGLRREAEQRSFLSFVDEAYAELEGRDPRLVTVAARGLDPSEVHEIVYRAVARRRP